jgi:hypothetical protein
MKPSKALAAVTVAGLMTLSCSESSSNKTQKITDQTKQDTANVLVIDASSSTTDDESTLKLFDGENGTTVKDETDETIAKLEDALKANIEKETAIKNETIAKSGALNTSKASTKKVEIQIDPAVRELVTTTFPTLDKRTLKEVIEVFQMTLNDERSRAKTVEDLTLLAKLTEASLSGGIKKSTELAQQNSQHPNIRKLTDEADEIADFIKETQERSKEMDVLDQERARLDQESARLDQENATINATAMKNVLAFYQLYKISNSIEVKQGFLEGIAGWKELFDKFGE